MRLVIWRIDFSNPDGSVFSDYAFGHDYVGIKIHSYLKLHPQATVSVATHREVVLNV